MDNSLFEELLQEIDTMTSEEYSSLFREAEKLANFPPEKSSFYPVEFSNILTKDIPCNFDNTFNEEAILIPHNYYRETILDGDDLCLKAA
jgi:hypothetical protein